MSPTKKRQTMAKIARERELKERRALKQERKDERRQAAAERNANSDDSAFSAQVADGETDAG